MTHDVLSLEAAAPIPVYDSLAAAGEAIAYAQYQGRQAAPDASSQSKAALDDTSSSPPSAQRVGAMAMATS